MTRAEEAANKAHPVDDNSVFNYALNLGFVEGYEQAEKFFISKLEEYMAKGEKFMEDDSNYEFWDGFHNCATNLLRELE